jgi:hypothetical protein
VIGGLLIFGVPACIFSSKFPRCNRTKIPFLAISCCLRERNCGFPFYPDIGRSRPSLRIVTGDSVDLSSAPPILARPNNRNCLNCLHIEKIAIDTYQ